MSANEKPKHDLSALRINRDEEPRERNVAGIIKWVVILLVVLGLGALVYSRVIAPRSYPEVELTTVQPSVNVVNDQLLTASGYLVADKQATITPKVAGRVVAINFEVGSQVTAGQSLVVLESDELRAMIREAEAAHAEALREFNRERALFREGVTSRAMFDSADAQMKTSRARLDRIRVNLADMVVRAPFSGTITTESVELGEIVTPMTMGTPSGGRSGAIATLSDLNTLEVEVDVNENNVGKMKVGQPAEVTVDAFPGRKFRAQVRKILPTANRAKGVVQARVAISDDKAGLVPDMSATVSFLERAKTDAELAEKPKLWVSASSVGRDSDGPYVVTITADNRVKFTRVTTGASKEGRTEIVSGLTAGTKIVSSDLEGLEEGTKVKLPE
jgi:HlyD family secretion protein